MTKRDAVAFEKDRVVVETMRRAGEPTGVIDEFLLCLDLSDEERDQLRVPARAEKTDIASGDAIEMNPLLSQPQRSKQR
jgi:hypothetical protein